LVREREESSRIASRPNPDTTSALVAVGPVGHRVAVAIAWLAHGAPRCWARSLLPFWLVPA
jgi:hypothetical protein